jgi:hypothetical protein
MYFNLFVIKLNLQYLKQNSVFWKHSRADLEAVQVWIRPSRYGIDSNDKYKYIRVMIANLILKIRLDNLDPAPGGPASDLEANH